MTSCATVIKCLAKPRRPQARHRSAISGIARIMPSDHLEHQRVVAHRAGHRADMVDRNCTRAAPGGRSTSVAAGTAKRVPRRDHRAIGLRKEARGPTFAKPSSLPTLSAGGDWIRTSRDCLYHTLQEGRPRVHRPQLDWRRAQSPGDFVSAERLPISSGQPVAHFDFKRPRTGSSLTPPGGEWIRTIGPAEKEMAVERLPWPTIVVSRDDLCLMTPSSLSVRDLPSATTRGLSQERDR